MGCYFGCGTCGARCSWAFWVIFLLAGAGCLVGFGLSAVSCGVEVATCGEDNGLVLPPEQSATSEVWNSQNPDWAYETCAALYPGNTTAIPLCVECANQGASCAATPFYLFIIGVIVLALCWIPCFYFCCCASPPEPKHPVYTQPPPGTYATTAQQPGISAGVQFPSTQPSEYPKV